jgi:hypothetical protein
MASQIEGGERVSPASRRLSHSSKSQNSRRLTDYSRCWCVGHEGATAEGAGTVEGLGAIEAETNSNTAIVVATQIGEQR